MVVVPMAYLIIANRDSVPTFFAYGGQNGDGEKSFGVAPLVAGVCLSLLAQIAEQVDYLRFMPPRTEANRRSWWRAVILAGPGWVILGAIKQARSSRWWAFSWRVPHRHPGSGGRIDRERARPPVPCDADDGIEPPMFDANGNPSGEVLRCQVCRQDYERPDMCACHIRPTCVRCAWLSTDKVGDHVLPAGA